MDEMEAVTDCGIMCTGSRRPFSSKTLRMSEKAILLIYVSTLSAVISVLADLLSISAWIAAAISGFERFSLPITIAVLAE